MSKCPNTGVPVKFCTCIACRKPAPSAAEAPAAYPSHDGNGLWLLMYADQDKAPIAFMGTGADEAARKTFERASAQWTCRLFRCVAETGYGPCT